MFPRQSGLSPAFPTLPIVLVSSALLVGCTPPDIEDPTEEEPTSIFTILTAEDNMTQGMAMVLSNQVQEGDADVRVLLCGPGAELAIEEQDGDILEPREVTPGQLLENLLERDVVVEVCAIFLPNTDWTEEDLRDGVGVAEPPEVAEHMQRPETKLFTF